jgi:hypothetical protein
VAKLTRLAHKIAIQLHLMAESCTICSPRSRRPVRKFWLRPRTFFEQGGTILETMALGVMTVVVTLIKDVSSVVENFLRIRY